MEPPKEIMEIMTAKPNSAKNYNKNYTKVVEVMRDNAMTDIAIFAEPEYRLAGIAINPSNFTASRSGPSNNSIRLNDLTTGKSTEINGMPNNAQVSGIKWSPTEKYICFLNYTPKELELWRIEVASATAKKINKYPLNSVLGGGEVYVFLDDERILYKAVPPGIGAIPEPPAVPYGPVIQESYGKTKTLRTNTYLLSCYYDEQLFDYFATSQFALFAPEGSKLVGPKAIVRSYTLSPGKNYMMITTVHKPYSYQEGHGAFPSKSEVWDIDGNIIKLLEDRTKEEERPARNSTNSEPRKSGYGWRSDFPETLVWTESLSPIPSPRGEPAADRQDEEKKDEPERRFTTALFQLHAPFDGEKQLVIRPEYPIGQVAWGNPKFAVFSETRTKEKVRNTFSFVPCDTTKAPVFLFSESTEIDSLNVFPPAIGTPYRTRNSIGGDVVYVDDKLTHIFLSGSRRDGEGDRMNFLDRFDLKTKKATNLWTGQAPYSETITNMLDFKNVKFVLRRESETDHPNLFIVDLKNKKTQQITFEKDPTPVLRTIQRQFHTYTRKDGVVLTGMLYLPPGYDPEKDGKLPVFMWGYPGEFKCVADAERARMSRYAFNVANYFYAALQGYAVFNFSTPIIAVNTKAPANDVFREQLIMNAEAAIDYLDSIGVGDRNRVGVGGHSYGAFMTANLLAHTKLFKAGIARSGAYNRTLTPNGFQNESRNYWKAPQVYYEMSPFSYANQLKTPILLIHGQMDSNNGTFPVQSERLYHAVSSLGGNVRYVQLPYESHGYSAKQSQLHVMYETLTFLDKHVKNAKSAKEKEETK